MKLKKIVKCLLRICAIIVALVIVLIIFLWIKSPGKTDTIRDSNGKIPDKSIARIEKIRLRGTDQYLVIRGADSTKPVMLYLHGGPGGPEVALIEKTNRAIENDFLMIYWEQYGAGKSYPKHLSEGRMKLAEFILDTKELSEMLIKRFKQNKIFIMGHSWGSLLGICTANQYPQLFYAYFGMGQVSYQYKGEQISFNWVKEQAKLHNDIEAIEELSELSFPDSLANDEAWLKFIPVERSYVTTFGGGITHKMRGTWPLIRTVLMAKEYTLIEKINGMKGSQISTKLLWRELCKKNLFNEIDSMQVPVIIFQGLHDYQVPHSLAKNFFEQLKAPEKVFFTFSNSAHSPIIEEPEKFNSILKEKTNYILNQK